jgi:hypothetical protein
LKVSFFFFHAWLFGWLFVFFILLFLTIRKIHLLVPSHRHWKDFLLKRNLFLWIILFLRD